jgi:hypothetical protein
MKYITASMLTAIFCLRPSGQECQKLGYCSTIGIIMDLLFRVLEVDAEFEKPPIVRDERTDSYWDDQR